MRTPRRLFLVRFLLFLLHPEDSSNPANLRDRQPHFAQFDNRLGGALKIGFWIVAVIVFWTTVPTLCGHLKRHAVPNHREHRAPLARAFASAADSAAVIGSSNEMSICTDFTGSQPLQYHFVLPSSNNHAFGPLPSATPAHQRPFFPLNRCRERI